ncbi:hypothetical protein JCM6882_009098 [Rhodosporidiobolus microsporus]
MIRPAVTSAYLAQQALRSAAPSSPIYGSPSKAADEMDDSEDDDSSDDESEGRLIEEHFLDPDSKEGIKVRLRGYSQEISPLGRTFLPKDEEILRRATRFTEVLDGHYVVIQVLQGDKVLHSERHPLNMHEHSYIYRWQAGTPHGYMPTRTRHPSRDARLAASRRLSESRPSLRSRPSDQDGDDSDSSLPDLVDALGRVDPISRAAPSVSSGVLHPHTLPLSAPPPPSARRRRSSPPPAEPALALPVGSPPPFADLPGVALGDGTAREELVQLYHFTAASEHRDSTALGRLLEGAAEPAWTRRATRDVPVTVMSRRVTRDGIEMVFDVVQQEEVAEEVAEDEDEQDAVELSQRQETVGR